MWNMGMYIESAVRVAVDRSLNGKKANQEYIKVPMLSELNKDEGIMQEEIDNRELKKMILNEELWIANARIKGLSETKIK